MPPSVSPARAGDPRRARAPEPRHAAVRAAARAAVSALPGVVPRRSDDELPTGSGARQAVLTGLRALGVLTWLVFVVSSLGPAVVVNLHNRGHLLPQTWVLLAAQPVLLAGMLDRRLGRRWLTVTGLVLFAALVAWVPHRDEIRPVNWWAPGYWAVGWTLWATQVLRVRTQVVVHVVAIGSLMLLDLAGLVVRHVPLTGLELAPIPWIAVPAVLNLLFGAGLLQLADIADRQQLRQREAERRSERERAATEARREGARLLHDHVLHALNALGRGQLAPGLVRDECRRAVDAVEGSMRPAGPLGALPVEDVIAADPLVDQLGVVVRGYTDPLPGAVVRAMAAASHEALGNVQRHARASSCSVDVAQLPGHWQVTITDDGRGFNPDRTPLGRLGLQRSVHERMEDVGGTATVTSGAGRGTRIDLRWPAPVTARAWPRMGSLAMRRVMLRTAWPGLAVSFAMLLLIGTRLHPAAPVLVAALAGLGVGCWYAIRLRDRELQAGGAVVLLATSLGIWSVNLLVAPGHPGVTYDLWLGWLAGALLHLVVLQVDLRRGLAILAGWALVMLACLWAATGWSGLWFLQTSVTTGVGECFVAIVALRVARGVIDQNAAREHLTAQIQRATGRLALTAHVDRYWSYRVTGIAMPLLREVVAGRIDVCDPSVQASARGLEATLRDELVLGPGNAELLVALNGLRRSGWTVTSSLSDDQSAAELQRAARLVGLLGEPVTPGQAVTLSASRRQAVALVLDPDPEQVTAWRVGVRRLGADLVVDEGFVRLRLPLSSDLGAEPEYMI